MALSFCTPWRVIVLSALIAVTRSDRCIDSNGESVHGKAWSYINKISGKSLQIKDHDFNSTYTLGICKNLLPESPSEYAGALEKTEDNRTIVLGRYNDSEIMYGSHWILLKYQNGEPYQNRCNETNRQAAIMFVCNHDISVLEKARIIDENMGRQKNCYHLFEIEHCIACVSDGCDAFFHRLSPGTVILIGFFSVIALYLLVGWLYTRCFTKKRGWKQLPHAEFWQEIGHLQADGCAMVCRCGKRREDDYNLIGGESREENPNYPNIPSNHLLTDDEELLSS